MKKRLFTIAGLLCATFGVLFGAMFTDTTATASSEPVVAEAANGTKTVCVDFSFNEKWSLPTTEFSNRYWYDDAFNIYCHYWGGTQGSDWPGKLMTSSSSNKFRKAEIPSDSTYVIFSARKKDDPSYEFARTDNLALQTNGENVCFIKNYGYDKDGNHCFNVQWSSQTIDSPNNTQDTMRLWFEVQLSWWWHSSNGWHVQLVGEDDGYHNVLSKPNFFYDPYHTQGFTSESNRGWVYFDVPVSLKYFQICCVWRNCDASWNSGFQPSNTEAYSSQMEFHEEMLGGIGYLTGDVVGERQYKLEFKDIQDNTGSLKGIWPNTFNAFVDGFTVRNGNINGYESFLTLKKIFNSRLGFSDVSVLDDYYHADYDVGDRSGKNKVYSAKAKYNLLESEFNDAYPMHTNIDEFGDLFYDGQPNEEVCTHLYENTIIYSDRNGGNHASISASSRSLDSKYGSISIPNKRVRYNIGNDGTNEHLGSIGTEKTGNLEYLQNGGIYTLQMFVDTSGLSSGNKFRLEYKYNCYSDVTSSHVGFFVEITNDGTCTYSGKQGVMSVYNVAYDNNSKILKLTFVKSNFNRYPTSVDPNKSLIDGDYFDMYAKGNSIAGKFILVDDFLIYDASIEHVPFEHTSSDDQQRWNDHIYKANNLSVEKINHLINANGHLYGVELSNNTKTPGTDPYYAAFYLNNFTKMVSGTKYMFVIDFEEIPTFSKLYVEVPEQGIGSLITINSDGTITYEKKNKDTIDLSGVTYTGKQLFIPITPYSDIPSGSGGSFAHWHQVRFTFQQDAGKDFSAKIINARYYDYNIFEDFYKNSLSIEYGNYLKICTNGECKTYSLTKNTWNNVVAPAYESLNKLTRDAWRNDEYITRDTSDKLVEDSRSLYDFVMIKYDSTYEDFANRVKNASFRGNANLTRYLANNSSDATLIIIIVSSSLLLLSAAATTLLIIKKKKTKKQ